MLQYKEMPLEKGVTRLVRKRRAYLPLGNAIPLLDETTGNNDLLDTPRAKLGIAEESIGKIKIFCLDLEPLRDEALDPNRLRLLGVQADTPESLRTGVLDFMKLVVGPFANWPTPRAVRFHVFFRPPFFASTNPSRSSAEIFLSSIFRKAKPYAGF